MMDTPLEHAQLQELVAGFADGELAPDQQRAVEEHLPGCARCQREMSLQQDLARALGLEPAGAASAGLRLRIGQLGPPPSRRRAFLLGRRRALPAAAAFAVLCAGAAIVWRASRDTGSRPIAETPLLRDALADCRRATGRNFPRKADLQAVSEGLPFPVRALDRPDAELFSTWKTTLAGSPAAGLAYRWRGKVVVQYAVPAELLRQQPGVAETLVRRGFYTAAEQGQRIVALVGAGGGTLLVGDAPPEELRRLIL